MYYVETLITTSKFEDLKNDLEFIELLQNYK